MRRVGPPFLIPSLRVYSEGVPHPDDVSDVPAGGDEGNALTQLTQAQAEEIKALRARIVALEEEVQAGLEAEEMLKGVFAAVPAFVVRYGHDYRIKSISRLQPGFDRDGVVGTHFFDYVPPAHRAVAQAAIERAWQTGLPQHYEIEGAGPNGKPAFYESYVAPVRDRDGSLGIMLVAIDVTAQRAQSEALRQSESMLQLALESTGMGLWVQDLTTNQVTWNENAFRIFGRDRPLNAQEYMNSLVHPDDRPIVQREMAKPLVAGRFHTAPHRIVRPDGSVRWVATIRQVLCDEEGRPTNMIGGTQDITEQHEMELRARHAQRMEAVGQLTAGIAHNFNNMLAAIVPALDLMTPALPQTLSSIAEGAKESASRATSMVRQLMTFAGKRTVPARLTRTSEVVHRSLAMCQTLFEKNIVLQVIEHDDVGVFLGPSDLEQALINVFLNARDAVLASSRPQKIVTISTSRFVGQPSDGQRACLPEGSFAKIQIADNGTGMNPEVRARVFEPFFTTKEVGRGTGLGLAMVYAVVTQAGGCVLCHSDAGRGTEVVLYLPEAKAPVVAMPAAPTQLVVAPANRIVLVVEDEETVATATLAVLRKSGVQAHRAAGLVEALELARSQPDAHLVLLDRSMPGGPADKIVPDLRRLLPKARIVFFTGEDLSPEEAQQVDAVLLKPMSARELLAFVARVVPQ